MDVTNRSKQKGTSFETLIVNYLVELGYDAERQVLKGTKDEGDIRVRIPGEPGFNLEAKNCKAMSLGAWVDEAMVETVNAGRPVFVVHKRIGRGVARDQFVTMTLDQFLSWFSPKDSSHS